MYTSVAVVVVGAAVSIAGGCALLRSAEGQLADQVARYCREPIDKRAAMRDYVNAAVKPNRLAIDCAVDQPKP